jgi:hypothetical protein
VSLLEKKPPKLSPRSCGLCRFWAPWLRQSDILGTCGGPQIGQCTDATETCEGFEPKGYTQPATSV